VAGVRRAYSMGYRGSARQTARGHNQCEGALAVDRDAAGKSEVLRVRIASAKINEQQVW